MKVSIITATFNSANTLSDTLESVLRQTYQNIDYWIIDGKSSDGTIDLIKSYETQFHGRLHWVSEPDNGLYDAMNKGITLCTGDVVGILNSDDFFSHDNIIEEVVRTFSSEIDAVYGDVHFVRCNALSKCVRYYSGRLFTPSMVKYGFIAPHPSFYIRREIYERYGKFKTNYEIAADFELIARLCYKHKIRTRYLHLDFVTMRVGGTSTRNIKARLMGMKETVRACHELNIRTSKWQIGCKYIIKIFSSIFIRK